MLHYEVYLTWTFIVLATFSSTHRYLIFRRAHLNGDLTVEVGSEVVAFHVQALHYDPVIPSFRIRTAVRPFCSGGCGFESLQGLSFMITSCLLNEVDLMK